ncbi:hypothetical protein [Alkalicoccus daliensis]|uniref:Citrate transporter-like domain-containing protein n=1 Tax=Alkalicoccus daliensis TaxID=745820 RepID=A0A1H0AHC6_9BACI|nr:hypothetical protein [Alkalicoccus daliensis]SDN33002.1 hypothetical protein SAMN04488053_101489 [Alkalicoccus daliensis]
MNIRSHHYLFFTCVVALYLLSLIINHYLLHYFLAFATIILFAMSFPYASFLFRLLAGIFGSIGLALLFIYPMAGMETILYVNENLSLLALLFMLPWMNSIVRAGRYDRRINELLSANVSDLGRLYQRASVTSYILVAFINLSALSLSQGVLKENMRNYELQLQQKFIVQTTLRAFAVALCWSPMEILVAISVDATGVSYFTMLPWLMLVSFLTLTLDGVVGRWRYRAISYKAPEKTVSTKGILKPISILTGALSLFLLTIVAIGNLFELNFILTVTIVIFPFAFLWAASVRRIKSFLAVGLPVWKERNNHMQNFILLFVSLAFFSTALNQTPLLETIQSPFLAMEDTPWVVLFMIQFTYLLMSMIGIHPIATIAVLIEAITPLFAAANPLSFSIVLVSGALATATVGTYGITVNISAMNTGLNPYRITWMNMPYALLYGGVGTVVAILLL